MFNGEAFGKEMTDIVRGYVERAIAPLVAENKALAERVAELEAREPLQGEKGLPGDKGEPGRDGVGLSDAMKDADGNLVLIMADGTTRNLGPINGKDGRDGIDGKDGAPGEALTLDDFDIEHTDDRTFLFKFIKGEYCHSFEFEFPIMIYRGVYTEGAEYTRGDVVTWAGSLWHCNAPTAEKPGGEGWTLAVKKGRDGKDLRA
jgi:integrin beta 3